MPLARAGSEGHVGAVKTAPINNPILKMRRSRGKNAFDNYVGVEGFNQQNNSITDLDVCNYFIRYHKDVVDVKSVNWTDVVFVRFKNSEAAEKFISLAYHIFCGVQLKIHDVVQFLMDKNLMQRRDMARVLLGRLFDMTMMEGSGAVATKESGQEISPIIRKRAHRGTNIFDRFVGVDGFNQCNNDVNAVDVCNYFSQYHKDVVDVKMVVVNSTDFAFVRFKTSEAAEIFVSLGYHVYYGVDLTLHDVVDFLRNKNDDQRTKIARILLGMVYEQSMMEGSNTEHITNPILRMRANRGENAFDRYVGVEGFNKYSLDVGFKDLREYFTNNHENVVDIKWVNWTHIMFVRFKTSEAAEKFLSLAYHVFYGVDLTLHDLVEFLRNKNDAQREEIARTLLGRVFEQAMMEGNETEALKTQETSNPLLSMRANRKKNAFDNYVGVEGFNNCKNTITDLDVCNYFIRYHKDVVDVKSFNWSDVVFVRFKTSEAAEKFISLGYHIFCGVQLKVLDVLGFLRDKNSLQKEEAARILLGMKFYEAWASVEDKSVTTNGASKTNTNIKKIDSVKISSSKTVSTKTGSVKTNVNLPKWTRKAATEMDFGPFANKEDGEGLREIVIQKLKLGSKDVGPIKWMRKGDGLIARFLIRQDQSKISFWLKLWNNLGVELAGKTVSAS